ncbi:MAG: RagB/SusD family nutrient uptake outer membrane protein, partial [Bacteroidota bacterium]
FQIENEGNSEFVWVRPGVATINREAGMSFMNFAWPNDFAVDTRSGLEFCDGCRNFAQEYRLHDDFYASFEDTDTRTELMLVEYVNTSGDTINILPPNDNVRPFKYWPGEGDPIGPGYGNDIPVIRYADILLSRAEALNELNGPNQESIDLINLVRQRAGVSNINLADYGSTDALNDFILEERGRELWWEGKRRADLIRHGVLVSRAQARGVQGAEPHEVRFPIPLVALDANPSLEQNPGY